VVVVVREQTSVPVHLVLRVQCRRQERHRQLHHLVVVWPRRQQVQAPWPHRPWAA